LMACGEYVEKLCKMVAKSCADEAARTHAPFTELCILNKFGLNPVDERKY
jgi:hypothetical protein